MSEYVREHKFEMLSRYKTEFYELFSLEETLRDPKFHRWAHDLDSASQDRLLDELVDLDLERAELPAHDLLKRLSGDLPIIPPYNFLHYWQL